MYVCICVSYTHIQYNIIYIYIYIYTPARYVFVDITRTKFHLLPSIRMICKKKTVEITKNVAR